MEYSNSSLNTESSTKLLCKFPLQKKSKNLSYLTSHEQKEKISFSSKMKLQNSITIILLSFFSGISFISSLTLSLFLKDRLHFQPSQMAYIRLAQSFPWIIRPLYGYISDFHPIFGLKRKSYLIILFIKYSLAWFILSYFSYHITMVFIAVVLVQFSLAFIAVVNRAIIIETSKLYEDIDGKINEFVNISSMAQVIGKLVASLFEGVIAEKFNPRYVFILSSFISAIVLIAAILFIEKYEGFEKHDLFYSFFSTSSTSDFEVSSKKKENNSQKVFKKFICNYRVYPALLFVIIYNSVPSSQSAVFYFSTNELKISPIEMGYISVLCNLSMLISMLIYKKYLQKVSWLKMLTVTTLINFIFGFPYIAMNFNSSFRNFLLLIGRCSSAVIEQFAFTPFLCFASMITPKNFLATGTAIVTTCWNIGLTSSEAFSGILSAYLGITSENFDNFYVLILIERLGKVLTLMILCFVKVHVPKKRKTNGGNIYAEGKLTIN